MSLGRKSLIPILFLVVAFAGTWAPVSAQAPPPKYAYVANWTDNTVSGYLRDATTGVLTQIAGSPWLAGNAPAGVAVDQTGTCVFVANFLSNNVSAYKITASTGVLTQVTGSPYTTGTAPIAVAVDFFSELVYVANAFGGSGNLGNISAFQTSSATCALTGVAGSPFRDPGVFSTPSSVVVERTGNFVYVTNEFSNNVSGFKINLAPGPSFGALTAIGAPTAAGTWPISVVAVPASGVNFIYVSNDGSNNVSGYSFDGTTGVLTAVPSSPFLLRNATSPGLITVAPGTRQLYVPNFDSNNVSGINIFTTCTPPWPPSPCTPTGAMAEVTGSPWRTGSGPTSVAVDPSGKFAYVTSMLSNDVWGYNINGSNGALTVSGAPVPAGQFAISVFFTP